MADKLKFNIVKENFQKFMDRLSDLTTIDSTIKLKIDNEHILAYSMLGGKVMLGFKNYLLNTKEFFDLKEDIDFTLDIVLPNTNKLVKNLDFLATSDKISVDITYKESPDDETLMQARSIQFNGGKLKVKWLTGENFEVRDITKNILKQRLDIKNRDWSFILNKQEFADIKKLSGINSEKIINIDVNDGKVTISENKAWELEVDEVEKKSAKLIFNKRFFKCIDGEKEEIEFHLFESFMLIKDENSNLMLSYEQDFDEEDVY